MSFQAYLDNIYAKTGKTADDFKMLAAEKGLTQTAEILVWLKADFSLGHGHAMAIIHLIVHKEHNEAGRDERLDKLFTGAKAKWRGAFDELLEKLKQQGADVAISPGQTYINLQRGQKKFGIVQPSSAERLDVGIKLKGAEPGGRFEAAGAWNSMVTHRVRITDNAQIDDDLVDWLKKAYSAAS